MQPKKPNFLIIGAAKCGTTSLASILAEHPDVCMSRPKEISFFQDNWNHKPNPNYKRGWEWYQNFFQHYDGENLVGEATPSYSDRTTSPNTAKRIHSFNPDMKIIYMVRKPIERQVSAWKMLYTFNLGNIGHGIEEEWASKGFDFWLQKQKESNQWDQCKYYYQLEAYLEYFKEKNIMVSFLEDWKKHQKEEVNRILSFLNLSNEISDAVLFTKDNTQDSIKIATISQRSFFKTAIWKYVKLLIPKKIKFYLVKTIINNRVKFPSVDYSSSLVKEFQNYINQDNRKILSKYGKSPSFWDTI